MADVDGDAAQRVLVVDDDPQMRAVISRVLSRAGYDVDETDRAEEALRILGERDFDLLIIDLVMPGMPGWELVDLLPAGVARVFVSGHAAAAVVDYSAALRQELMLEKPFDAETLLELTSLALARRRG